MIEQLIKDITILLQDGDFVKAEEKCKELESKQLSDKKNFSSMILKIEFTAPLVA